MSVDEIAEARHRADEAEGLLRRVFETSLDLIVVTDSYGQLVRVSPSAKLLLGYDPEEMIGGSGVEFIYPEDLERTRDQMRAARRTGNPQSFECRYVHREGRTVTFWWQGIWSAAERQYFFSGRDITDRKRAERLQAYYAAIIESTADAIIATDLDGGVTSWNKAAELIFGYSASEMVGEPIFCLLPSDRPEEEDTILAQIRRGERIEHFETMRRRKDGTEFPVSLTISPILEPDGEIIGASKIVRDITERNRMEKDLRVSAEQLNRAQRLAQMGSDTRDLRTDIAVWSDETYRIFGIDRGAPVPSTEAFLQMVHPDDRAAILKARERLKKGGNPTPFEYRFVRADGSVRHIHRESEVIKGEDGNPLYMMGTIHDITDRRRTEEQLRQAQKMEAIGNLTGGMAHDFNNLLGVIVGNLDLASAQIGNDEELKELVGEALEAAWRGADLTRRLLAFARRQPLRPARVEVNDLVNDTVRLLRRLLGEDIEVSVDLGGKLWPVTVDPAQLEASLANLATNARDAMPGGGRLIIATANRRLDADYAAAHSDVTTGDFVTIEISDTGTGMPPEVVSQIFEPFFTTKEQGRGTGLGLSMVFGFLRQSGGHVNVYSELGKGTTFRLYLPRADDDEAPREIVQVAPISRGAGETVLMVEDNPGMRRIVLRQLRNLGYYVLDCDSGAAALDILQREPVDLLLTDIVMPGGLDGVELAHVAQQRWPALKIVLTSGFPQARVDRNGELLNGLQLLSKPYHREELAAALCAALGG